MKRMCVSLLLMIFIYNFTIFAYAAENKIDLVFPNDQEKIDITIIDRLGAEMNGELSLRKDGFYNYTFISDGESNTVSKVYLLPVPDEYGEFVKFRAENGNDTTFIACESDSDKGILVSIIYEINGQSLVKAWIPFRYIEIIEKMEQTTATVLENDLHLEFKLQDNSFALVGDNDEEIKIILNSNGDYILNDNIVFIVPAFKVNEEGQLRVRIYHTSNNEMLFEVWAQYDSIANILEYENSVVWRNITDNVLTNDLDKDVNTSANTLSKTNDDTSTDSSVNTVDDSANAFTNTSDNTIKDDLIDPAARTNNLNIYLLWLIFVLLAGYILFFFYYHIKIVKYSKGVKKEVKNLCNSVDTNSDVIKCNIDEILEIVKKDRSYVGQDTERNRERYLIQEIEDTSQASNELKYNPSSNPIYESSIEQYEDYDTKLMKLLNKLYLEEYNNYGWKKELTQLNYKVSFLNYNDSRHDFSETGDNSSSILALITTPDNKYFIVPSANITKKDLVTVSCRKCYNDTFNCPITLKKLAVANKNANCYTVSIMGIISA